VNINTIKITVQLSLYIISQVLDFCELMLKNEDFLGEAGGVGSKKSLLE